ncbi:MAG: 50S ribosomal protein L35 [Puniceicoccales bacterium]|jgi:large subunit ribosomal protein L35|nr:50S ribosomal protein L35 [Puniceicoccales bacterium]
MRKTRKSIAKRFKLTAGGKVLRRTAGRGHLLRHKSAKQRRRSGVDKSVSAGFASHVLAAMPYGR